MPHQCVRCNKIYPDGSQELLKGCECGGRFFFYIRKNALKEAQKLTKNLTPEEKKQMEHDVLEIIGDKLEDNKPIILDLESIKILKPGKYELDLVDIFKGRPLVYKLEEGKYFIDVASTFEAKDLSEKTQKPKANASQED